MGEYTGLVHYTASRHHVLQTYYMLDYDNMYAQYTGHVVIDAAQLVRSLVEYSRACRVTDIDRAMKRGTSTTTSRSAPHRMCRSTKCG